MINRHIHLTLCAEFIPLLAGLIALCPMLHAQDIEIHQLDVGQGDAALVIVRQPSSPLTQGETEEGSYSLLIDSGPKGKGRNVIVPYLRKLGIDTLNAIISTHYHADHIGGVNEVLNSEVVLKCYDRGGSYDSKAFDNYVSLSGNRRATLNAGDTLISFYSTILPKGSLFGTPFQCSIICLASGGNILNYGYAGTSDENTNSIALLVTFISDADTFKFLTAGDILRDQESLIASNNPCTHHVSVMKISHHGSHSSTSTDALQWFAPRAVFISCGDQNQYDHPHAETLRTLDDQKSIEHIYQTERGDNVGEKSIVSGNIIVKVYSNGSYTIKTDDRFDSFYFSHKSLSLLQPRRKEKVLKTGQIGWNTQYHDSAISLSIRPPVFVQTISVLNILGTTLRRFSPMAYLGSVSISDNFNSGVYFVMVRTESRATMSKVIVDQ